MLSVAVIVFSVAYNTRLSLKKLKVLTSDEFMSGSEAVEENEEKREFLEQCKQILKYWAILGLFMLFEFHFEFMVRWLPGWFYIKAALILAVTFPQLRIGNMVFDRAIVPFLRKASKKIEDHGGLVNMVSLVLYSAPFLVVDVIFPAQLQFTTFIKQSFRIGHANSEDPLLNNIEEVNNHLADTVDYFVPSPVLSRDGDALEERESLQGKNSHMTSIGKSGRPSNVGFVSSTSPFHFSDSEEDREEPSVKFHDELSRSSMATKNYRKGFSNDTSRRLSSFNTSCMRLNEADSSSSASSTTDWRRASVATGSEFSSNLRGTMRPKSAFGDVFGGVGALFDLNVLSPPVTSSQRKARRETLMHSGVSIDKKRKASREKVASPLGSADILGTSSSSSSHRRRSNSSLRHSVGGKAPSRRSSRGSFGGENENENSLNLSNVEPSLLKMATSPTPERVSLSRRRLSSRRNSGGVL